MIMALISWVGDWTRECTLISHRAVQAMCVALSTHGAQAEEPTPECRVCSGAEAPLLSCAACGAGFHAACLALDSVPQVRNAQLKEGIHIA